MTIGPGSRLGSYTVVSSLGAGGMGEVFLAHDTSLGRDVALKTIRAPFADDADRLIRFRREAQVLASLNHPHIATIHDFNEIDRVAVLVMEYVPGETLGDRLARGRLAPAEAVRLCRQVAAALEAAHEKGIVHRDLKPGNVKITPDGTVKVLDFGLAKALTRTASSGDSSDPPTTAISEGVVLGTLPYMSPEQARGKPVDRRADIWAFGCVLFECLTGRRPFEGETTSDIVAAILDREPDWRLLPASTPAAVDRLLRRSLQKDLPHRLRDIGDAAIELDEAVAAPAGASAPGIGRPRSRAVWAAALLALGTALGAALMWSVRRPQADAVQPSGHFLVSLPNGERLANLDFPSVALSPNGSLIAYVASRGGRPQLFLRPLNSLASRLIPGSADAFAPFFSPDEQWVAFFAGGKLKKVAIDGGAPSVVCDAPSGFGGSWDAGDTIVFAPSTGSGLSRVAAGGGTPVPVTTVNAQRGEFSHRWPEWLPGGNAILFTIGTVGSWDDAQIVAHSVASGEQTVLMRGGTNPHYLASGHLMFARGGTLMTVPFDARRLEVRGTPTPVIDNVLESFDGAAHIAVAASGNAIYVGGRQATGQRRLVAVERSGASAPLAAAPAAYVGPRVSPDGNTVAITIGAATDEIWTYDISRNTPAQATFETSHTSPIWTPDGRRLAFTWAASGVGNLFWKLLPDGPEERLASSDHLQLPGAWSPDGRTLVFVQRDPATGRDLWLLDERRTPRPFLVSSSDESAPRFSPDGRLIAYVSNESGAIQVYVRPSADRTQAWQVSRDGGAEPVWDPSGGELFYRAGDRLMQSAVTGTAPPRLSAPRVVFEGKFEKGTIDSANYDVTRAHRFIMLEAMADTSRQDELHVLLNWRPSGISAPGRR